MKILIKHRYAVSYIDFTQYVEMPISMTQTVDGTFHTIDLKLLTPKKVGNNKYCYINSTKVYIKVY